MGPSKKEKKTSFARRTIENIFFSGISGIISKIGAFIFTIIVARSFFPEQFGIYSLALAIILTLLTISDLGLGGSIVRYLSESIGKKDLKQSRSRFLFLLKSKVSVSAITAILLFFLAGAIASFFKKPELILPLKVGAFYLFLTTISNLGDHFFLALQKVKYSTITQGIFQAARIIFIIVLIYFFKSVEGVFIVLSLSILLSLIYSVRIVAKKYPFFVKGKREPIERRRILKFSGFIALSSITLLIYSNVDKLVLGYFLDLKFIGFYTVIFTVLSGVLGLIGIIGVLFPVFTQLKGERLDLAFKRSFHYLSVIVFPMAIGLAFIFIPLIKNLYGIGYTPAQYLFPLTLTSILLSMVLLENSFSSIYRHLLNAKEKPKIPAFTNLFTFIVNLILNIILISYLIKIEPSYGLIGASVATFTSRYLGLAILLFFSKKEVGVTLRKDSIIKPLFSSLVMLGYLFLFSYLIDITIFTGIIMIITAAIIYFAIIFATKTLSFREIKSLLKK